MRYQDHVTLKQIKITAIYIQKHKKEYRYMKKRKRSNPCICCTKWKLSVWCGSTDRQYISVINRTCRKPSFRILTESLLIFNTILTVLHSQNAVIGYKQLNLLFSICKHKSTCLVWNRQTNTSKRSSTRKKKMLLKEALDRRIFFWEGA